MQKDDIWLRRAMYGGLEGKQRLKELRSGEKEPTRAEINTLWSMYSIDARSYCGEDHLITLVEFGQWLSGMGDYSGQGPIAVFW